MTRLELVVVGTVFFNKGFKKHVNDTRPSVIRGPFFTVLADRNAY